MQVTLYSLLDVSADADSVTIALAYARQLLSPRPDVERATLTYAFLVLSDPKRRAVYDSALYQPSKGIVELPGEAAEGPAITEDSATGEEQLDG